VSLPLSSIAVESRVYNSEGTLVRYNGKHLADNNSQYQTNIVLQLSDNETVKNATNALTKKHPDNSYIAKIDVEEGLSVSQPTKAIRPCSVCSILSFVCKLVIWAASCSAPKIEVNADGTKTMLTGGTKTVYSWDTDKGGMSQKTETVKSHSGVLKNPLILL
jgi:hypothetical protein